MEVGLIVKYGKAVPGRAKSVLSASRRTLVVFAGLALLLSSVALIQANATYADGGVIELVAAYDFDAGTGTTLADISGNGHTGTLEGGPTWVSNGKHGGALSFDGIDDLVTIADENQLDLTDGMTLEAWVKPAGNQPLWHSVLMKEAPPDTLTYGLYTFDNSPRGIANVQDVGEVGSYIEGGPAELSYNRWTHLAATFDGSAVRVYVNGDLVRTDEIPDGGGSASLDVLGTVGKSGEPQPHGPGSGRRTSSGMGAAIESTTGSLLVSEGALRIGGNNIWDDEWWHGLIDDVRIYNRPITQDEIQIDMGPSDAPAPRLVAAYNFDDGAGVTADDISGSGHAGTLEGPAWSSSGKHGGALSFDGVDDLVTVADADDLDLSDGMTLEAWINPSTVSGWRTVVLKEHPLGLAYGLYADGDVGAQDRPSTYLRLEDGSWGLTGGSAVQQGSWTHLAATFDGATMRLFINGTEVASRAQDGTIESTADPLRIGGNQFWGEYFHGLIDDLRIYDRALAMSDIQFDMDEPVKTYPANEEQQALIAQALGEGNISAEQAEAYQSDIRLVAQDVEITVESGPVEPEGFGIFSTGCYGWNYTERITSLGHTAADGTQHMYWCWNTSTKKVSNWAGYASHHIYVWGSSLGVSWQGWDPYVAMIPYSLSGSYPGGIHFYSKGKFKVGIWPYSPYYYVTLNQWGHWDGSVDWG